MKMTGPDGNDVELPEHVTAVWIRSYVKAGRWEACCLCGWYACSEILPFTDAEALLVNASLAAQQHVIASLGLDP